MNIDGLARWYRWAEYPAFGRSLEQARFVYLDRLRGARRVLALGDGDGRSLATLLAVAPEVRVDSVELSGAMIALARDRVGGGSRVDFRQGNALEIAWPSGQYDGVLTLFFLDCFSEAEAAGLVRRVVQAMAPGALWLVSDFAIPDRGWRKTHATLWLWTMYKFFGLTTGLRTQRLPPVQRLLADAGLECLEVFEQRAGLIRSEVWRKPGGGQHARSLIAGREGRD